MLPGLLPNSLGRTGTANDKGTRFPCEFRIVWEETGLIEMAETEFQARRLGGLPWSRHIFMTLSALAEESTNSDHPQRDQDGPVELLTEDASRRRIAASVQRHRRRMITCDRAKLTQLLTQRLPGPQTFRS
jgi:hypothetical protein